MREQILAVQRMQDYIEAHIHEEITLADLARVSHQRAFAREFGCNPKQYRFPSVCLSLTALNPGTLEGGMVRWKR